MFGGEKVLFDPPVSPLGRVLGCPFGDDAVSVVVPAFSLDPDLGLDIGDLVGNFGSPVDDAGFDDKVLGKFDERGALRAAGDKGFELVSVLAVEFFERGDVSLQVAGVPKLLELFALGRLVGFRCPLLLLGGVC